MRKLTLLAVSSMALLAVAVMATPAAADYTNCQGKPAGIQGFHLATVPTTGGAIADQFGGGAACGQDFNVIGRKAVTKFFILTAGDMDAKNGPKVRCQNPAHPETHAQRVANGFCEGDDLGPLNARNEGPYIGKGDMDLAICPAGVCGGVTHVTSTININKSAGRGFPNDPNDNCGPITVVGCYQAGDSLNTGTTDITIEPCWGVVLPRCREAGLNIGIADLDPQSSKYLMTVNPTDPAVPGTLVFYVQMGEVSYVSHPHSDPTTDLHICGRANLDPLATTCGTDDANWVHKNGPNLGTNNDYPCTPTKPEGYAARVAMTNGATMPDACSKIDWTP